MYSSSRSWSVSPREVWEPKILCEPRGSRPSRYIFRIYPLAFTRSICTTYIPGETLDITYRIGSSYIPKALERLDYFLRDHRTMAVITYDPRELDLLHSIMARLGRPSGLIDIVCGYRTPESNGYLRSRSAATGVAEHSQHMEGKAIDNKVPGCENSDPTRRGSLLGHRRRGVTIRQVTSFMSMSDQCGSGAMAPLLVASYDRRRSLRPRGQATWKLSGRCFAAAMVILSFYRSTVEGGERDHHSVVCSWKNH